jgi:hypothetical protein
MLEFIYKSKLIHNSAKKITGNNDLYEDLISELILIIRSTDHLKQQPLKKKPTKIM